jgi:hypothetical protein
MSSSFQTLLQASTFFITTAAGVTGYPALLILLVPVALVFAYYFHKAIWTLLWFVVQSVVSCAVGLYLLGGFLQWCATPQGQQVVADVVYQLNTFRTEFQRAYNASRGEL